MRHRVPQLLKNGGLYRHALCIYGRPKGAQRRRRPRRHSGAQFSLEQTPYNKVQRRFVHRAEGRGGHYTEAGRKQTDETIAYYLNNARIILEGLGKIGIKAYGGKNSPYVWLKTPNEMDSWDFFDKLMKEIGIVGTPGSGFGAAGQGYFRLTAFNTEEKTREAIERLSGLKL